MSTLTINLPDDQYERLRTLAAHSGVSLDKLIEEFSTRALAEFDVEFPRPSREGRTREGPRRTRCT